MKYVMKFFKKAALGELASDNRGGAGSIVLLAIVIIAAIALWALVIFGNFTNETFGDEGNVFVVPTSGAIEIDTDDNEEQDNEDETETNTEAKTLSDTDIARDYPGISDELDALAESYNCVAASLAIYDGDTNEVYTYEYGFADIAAQRIANVDTKFRVASLSNLVTAICVMSLVDDGLIDLDENLETYLGYNFRNPLFPDTKITARMMLQHTSSLFDSGTYEMSRNRNSSQSVQSLIETGRSFRKYKPGLTFGYSNFGFAVLGSLCEIVSGMPLDTLARERVFYPLDIDAAFVPSHLEDTENIAVIYESDHSIWRRVDAQLAIKTSATLGHDLHLASSNLTISAADYAKILTMLTCGGTYRRTEILTQESVNEMFDANVDSGLGYMQGLAVRYSLGDILGENDYYWHSGSSNGVFAQYIYNYELNHGVVVITTGASITRLDNGMVDACTELAQTAWKVFGNRTGTSSNGDDDDGGSNDDGSGLVEVG